MHRIEFYLSYDAGDLDQKLSDAIYRMEWLKDNFGDGDDWGNRTFFRPTRPLTHKWAFGTYQTLPINPIKFCLWIPDNIKLLYDIHWG